VAVECAARGAPPLHARGALWRAARCGGGSPRAERPALLRDRDPDGPRRSGPAGPHLPVPQARGAVRRPSDPAGARRGLAVPRQPAVRRAHPRVAQGAAQAQRGGGVRHPVARRRRRQRDRPGDRRELPPARVPAQRPRDRAPGARRLRAVRPQRTTGRVDRPRDPQARLLPAIPPRQPAVRPRAGPGGAGPVRRFGSAGAAADRRGARRARRRGVRGRLARGLRALVGGRRARGLSGSPTPRRRPAMKSYPLAALLAAAAPPALLAIGPTPADAIPVFDASNYAQNLLQAARALEQINHQIASLQNEARMLETMDRNLERLEFPEIERLRRTMERIDDLMAQARAIDFRVEGLDRRLEALFPGTGAQALAGEPRVARARERVAAARGGYLQAMRDRKGVGE